jgi:CRP/FNR family transcriptional regulator
MTILDWTERFKGTAALPLDVRKRLNKSARIIHMKKGNQIFGPMNIPDSLFFLYNGRIRISQTSDAGREIVLYHVDAGESCV